MTESGHQLPALVEHVLILRRKDFDELLNRDLIDRVGRLRLGPTAPHSKRQDQFHIDQGSQVVA
jgi:hypothetical protein